MKTIEELYKEISASDELKKVLSEIKDKAVLADFLKEHGCEASADEFAEYVRSQNEGELDDDGASAATGGYFGDRWFFSPTPSIETKSIL